MKAVALLPFVLLSACATGREWPALPEIRSDVLTLPDGGTVSQQGSRIDLYDAHSNRTGYGYVRGDGSIDLFNTDGTRRATIQQRPGGGVRVTTPGKR